MPFRSFIMFVAMAVFVSLTARGQTGANGSALYTRNCARCHETQPPLPRLALMKSMTPEYLVRVMTTGVMRLTGSGLKPDEKTELAEFVSGKKLDLRNVSAGACSANKPNSLSGPQWNGWGGDLENTRFQKSAGLTATQVPGLKVAWAFGFPGEYSTYSQPTVVGGRIFIGSAAGTVYSLDAQTGCTYWTFEAGAGVRSAITIGPDNVAYFGDTRANMFALNAATGKQLWKVQVETYPSARITGAPKLYKGRLFVPVSSRDEWFASDPSFECCKFRGSVSSLEAKTGKLLWKTYTVDEARPLEKKKGVQTWGPSGVGVWGSPTIDTKKELLYVGTGDGYSDPATPLSDAILAMSLQTGKIVWAQQMTPNDVFSANCIQPHKTTCPDKSGPDADFASSPILHTMADGRRFLLAGQKSGVLHALDPDHEGKVIWETKLGKAGMLGGIQWGPAADDDVIYAAISDVAFQGSAEGVILNPKVGGGLHALQIATGEKLWSAMPAGECKTPRCSPAQSAAITVIPGVVFSGSLDGHIRAYAAGDGAVLWDFDTVRDFQTVNEVAAKGGSLDGPGPVVVNGMVYVNSGYGGFNGIPGNVLVAFRRE